MQSIELNYAELIREVLNKGSRRPARYETFSLFGKSFEFSMEDDNLFPMIQGRQMFINGVLGEFAALLREPKHIDDFTKWGCNYWGLWAKEDGSINVDYGNAWVIGDQLGKLRDMLVNDPYNRRMIVNSWRPENLDELSLPCCHYGYQFYVRDNTYIDMIWQQRSVDVMIGLPSDIILAATWLIMLSNDVGLKPGRIKMDLGDVHVYTCHETGAHTYLNRLDNIKEELQTPTYTLNAKPGLDFRLFEPKHLSVNYESLTPIKFKLLK